MTDADWEALTLDACGAFGVDPRWGATQNTLKVWHSRFHHLPMQVVATALAELQVDTTGQLKLHQLPPVPLLVQRIKRVLDRAPQRSQKRLPPPVMLPAERDALAAECRQRALEIPAGPLANELNRMAEQLEKNAELQRTGQPIDPQFNFGRIVQVLAQGVVRHPKET